MKEETKHDGKVRRVVISVGISLALVVVSQIYRDEIGFYLRPELSLSLEAGPRSYSENRGENVRWLLERGISPNHRIPERRNYAPIHEAGHWGIESSLQLFVEAGAGLNQHVVNLEGKPNPPECFD